MQILAPKSGVRSSATFDYGGPGEFAKKLLGTFAGPSVVHVDINFSYSTMIPRVPTLIHSYYI